MAPAAWAKFVAAFNTYSQSVKDECVQAPLDMLPSAQGRAQQMVRTLEVLNNCRATSAKIISTANNQRKP